MKVAIVAPSPVPFNPGGAESLWNGLYRELSARTGHDVELVKLPIREMNLPQVMAAYRSFAELDLDHFDLVVSGKYPAWMVRHPRHVVYMLHPLRGLYDSYHWFGLPLVVERPVPEVRTLLARAATLSRDGVDGFFATWDEALIRLGVDHPQLAFPGPVARALVRALDRVALDGSQVWRHLAISRTVAAREGYFPPSVNVEVVYPPSDLKGLHDGPGEYFFTASRHDGPKRLDVLIDSMRYYRGERRLVIAGEGPLSPELRRRASGDRRIEFVGRVSQAQLVEHYARAVGVPFIPVDEDLGLITFEAMASGKPVLTAADSGGPTEFVTDGLNGVVVDPNPIAIGAGLARLEELARPRLTAEMARQAVADVSWRTVGDAILGENVPRAAAVTGRHLPRLVVTSTFPVWPPRNGGQMRAFHLYGALARWFDVHLVSQAPAASRSSSREIAPGLVEHVVPRTRDHAAAEARIGARVGIPVTDIVAGRLSRLTPRYGALLADLLDGAAGVLLADPFLHPAVAAVNAADVPVIYDAYNCEYILKEQILPGTPAGRDLLLEVNQVERDAVEDALVIASVSEEDRANLQSLYGAPAEKFALTPNGVDIEEVPFVGAEQRAVRTNSFVQSLNAQNVWREGEPIRYLALFIGSWHVPNNNAAMEIIRMSRELSEVGFLLLGSHVHAIPRRGLPRNVFPLGVASDAVKRAVLGASSVALAPLMEGSGTNLKVVEYLAAGVPVVTTPIGARGLSLEAGILTVADLPDFPQAIRTVLADSGGQERAERGRRAVERCYDWHEIAERLHPRLAAALGLEQPAPPLVECRPLV